MIIIKSKKIVVIMSERGRPVANRISRSKAGVVITQSADRMHSQIQGLMLCNSSSSRLTNVSNIPDRSGSTASVELGGNGGSTQVRSHGEVRLSWWKDEMSRGL